MANKKQLKKSVKHITTSLLTDCMVLSYCNDTNKEELEQIITEILALHNDYVARLSHVEPGQVKQFFRQFKTTFTEKVNALNERILKV